MKSVLSFAYLFLLHGAVIANVQTNNAIPACALTCVTTSPTFCSLLDTKCICLDQSYINAVTICVRNTCSPADRTAAGQYTEQQCASVGISVTFPSLSSTSAVASFYRSATSTVGNTMAGAVQTSAVTGAGVVGATDAAAPAAQVNAGNKGLSAGAAAGIGIGATLGVVAVAVGVFFLMRRRRQQSKAAGAPAEGVAAAIPAAGADADEKEVVKVQTQIRPHVGEIDGRSVDRGQELDGAGERAEPANGWGGHGQVHELR